MAEERRKEDWSHTSHVLWITAEIHRDGKRRPRAFVPDDFHPWKVTVPARKPSVGVDVLKQVFVDRQG